jgi:hypothetical protein
MINHNPREILLTLDQQLDHDVELVLYGRAAISLGFDQAPEILQATQDVDAIIRISQLTALTNDEQFWLAIDHTNQILSAKGLYITHLFAEDQVFLRPDWENHLVPIHTVQTQFLKLYRPHVIDLILTKMMRGNDALDMEDIAFLISSEKVMMEDMEKAFDSARLPEDIPELHEAFLRAIPSVKSIILANALCPPDP